MNERSLFQLGMDLDAGTTQTEEHANDTVITVIENARDALQEGRAREPSVRGDDERQDHFVRRNGKVFAGTHLIIELAEADGLDDPERIEKAFLDAIEAAGATLLHIHLHRFTPQGVSGVAVLAESHISVHTWPESRYAAFDVFMCGDARPHAAVKVLKEAFNAGIVQVTELHRGEGLVG